MNEPIAYLQGSWLPLSQASVSVLDGGFVQGVTIAEQLRTFGGQLFRLERHLERLSRSLSIVGVDPGLTLEKIAELAHETIARNRQLVEPADDLGLTMFVTPGVYATFSALARQPGPAVGIHAQPLPFFQWHEKYATGESLVVTDVMQVPGACWPTELKCRSRMHYFLADKRAREIEPGARALMLDETGHVTEASTANVVIYRTSEGLVSPPRESILPGVSVAVLEELAATLAIPFVHRRLLPVDFETADEVLLCSTSPCVWSVTRVNGKAISAGKPGPIAARLQAAWSDLVGLDIVAQARQFATRAFPQKS